MVAENQTMLVEGEGIKLMVIIMQFRLFASRYALKVLDYAMLRNTASCKRFVNAMGLKTLFPRFMKPSSICGTKNKEASEGPPNGCAHGVRLLLSAHALGSAQQKHPVCTYYT